MGREENGGSLQKIVREIMTLLERYGFGAFESRERAESYVRQHFPVQTEQVAACFRVLYLPRYLDCLERLQAEPRTAPLALQYWGYYETVIDAEAAGDPLMHSANRLFLLDRN